MKKFLLALTLAMMMCLGTSSLWAQFDVTDGAQPYVVQRGDTASKIAKKFYGKPALGKKLWAANRNLVDHPNVLTAGDTIYIFPEETLVKGKSTIVPPPPMKTPTSMYSREELVNTVFPKYFNFVADGRGLGGSGAIRITVKKKVPQKDNAGVTMIDDRGEEIYERVNVTYEVRKVGEIIGSAERGGYVYNDGAEKSKYSGRTILSTNDNVIIRFDEDLAKILDSDTYSDSDPYFRDFPIYGRSHDVRAGTAGRVDRGHTIGELYQHKGILTVVSRVEGLAPLPPRNTKALKNRKSGPNQGIEPVSYVARIKSSVDAVDLTDDVFIFIPINPGAERILDSPYVEAPDSYTPSGY